MVGHDEEPVADAVVARVDDHRQPIAESSLEAFGELGPADAAGERDDRPAGHGQSSRWSWTPVTRTMKVTRGWRAERRQLGGVEALGVVAVGQLHDVVAGAARRRR